MRCSIKFLFAFIFTSLLCSLMILGQAESDVYVSGGENRAVPTKLEPGILYSAEGNVCGFTSSPGERNADWYVIDTAGYDYALFHFPIVTTSDIHWIEVFDENGDYLESSKDANLNDEFNYIAIVTGNDRIYFQVLFNYFSSFSEHRARFSICLFNDREKENWEERSTHIWEDVRADKIVMEEPTCLQEGYKSMKRCVICGLRGYYETIPKVPHAPSEWVIESEPSCDETGREVKYCTVCDEVVEERVIPANGHDFTEWSVITPASYRTAGIHERYCQVCGKVEREDYTLTPPGDLLESGDYELVLLDDDSVRLITYYGTDLEVDLPQVFEGHPLTEIASTAFSNIDRLLSIVIPASVIAIDEGAFGSFPDIELTVARDSYALEYAKAHGIRYTYPDANDWLNQ